ncbi:mpv17/PMP22 [Artemisia annua]|uniref:Mpv17/PMP22 n=1 Tax=Artemisia annua TaxID=35608 RepID=A0A2U1KG98_ARTAN|nr:mpv17/PMP22 [Artemisia annua]
MKMGFLSWYLKMLDMRPLLTKSVSAGVIYGVADLTTQIMTMEASGSLSLIRTFRIAMFGLLILGPAQHVWFNYLGKILPKRDMITTLKKLIVGQIFYGPSCTAVFFTYNASLQGGLMYWPVCDFFTYKIVPVHLQPLMNSSFSFLWTIYLTYMASLAKASET